MNSAELGDISLSGLINTIISPPSDDQVVQVDPNTIQGQNQSITFHLQPMEDQVGPIRDVHDNIQGFPQQASDWNQELIHQTILEPKVVEQKPFVRILEQPASHKLRYRYKCEGRGAGALQGERSTTDKKSFHKQYAISLTAPRYHNVNIREPVRVCVELVKPSDDSRSEEEEFFYTPLNTSPAPAPAPGVKRETVLRNIESKEGVKNAGYHGGGCVTEVKMEDSTWKQMTSQAGQMINKQRVDPYSKVVMTEGNLGLCSSGYEYNIPVTSGQYHFTESQSPSYSISQPSPDSNGLANLNLASPDQVSRISQTIPGLMQQSLSLNVIIIKTPCNNLISLKKHPVCNNLSSPGC